jgi:hypothetical protein
MDSEEKINDCFEFDWDNITKPKFREMANPDSIKTVLKKFYPYL